MKLTATYLREIRNLIVAARTTVARGVDLVQVHTNFEIGRRIVEQEQKGKGRAAYGQEVIKALADRFMKEFGSGFSKSNLEYMRRFYLENQGRIKIAQTLSGQSTAIKKGHKLPIPIPQTASGESKFIGTLSGKSKPGTDRSFTLSWSHYVFLLSIKTIDERSFYEIESTSQNWTVRELKRQFDSSLYERLALSRDKKGIRKLAQRGQLLQDATIGIILCKKKNESLVEITLPKGANIHAREYKLYLPSKQVLQQKLQKWAAEVEG